MNYDEMKPKKIKLKPDQPESMFTPADKAMFGLLGLLMGTILLIALFGPKPGNAPETAIEQPLEGPGKTWKEPGSARDTFNENFSR